MNSGISSISSFAISLLSLGIVLPDYLIAKSAFSSEVALDLTLRI
jgi:hypothetical protein